MSHTTVPEIVVSGADTYSPEGTITLRVYRALGASDVPAADLVLTEDRAAEIIGELALALEATASYGALAAAIFAELPGVFKAVSA